MNTHRAKTKEPVKREAPTHIVTAPNQVLGYHLAKCDY
jgi:putative transposase